MSNIYNLPAASRFRTLSHTAKDPSQHFLLRVDHSAGLHDFLELIELIYGEAPTVRTADMVSIWVKVRATPHYSLAGARVAARVCGIVFEEVGNIT